MSNSAVRIIEPLSSIEAPREACRATLSPGVEAAALPEPKAEADSVEAMVREAQEGSLEAFERIVAAFENRVLNYLRQFTRNDYDAEDLAQVTFVKAYRGLGRFDARRSLLAWLFTIARRSAISQFRATRSVAFESPESLIDHADSGNPSLELDAKDQGLALWRLADRLKPRQREALWLHYAEDLPVAECARVMGLTQIHVKVLLHRGRQALAKLLQSSQHKTWEHKL